MEGGGSSLAIEASLVLFAKIAICVVFSTVHALMLNERHTRSDKRPRYSRKKGCMYVCMYMGL